jgi:hypothetical protein
MKPNPNRPQSAESAIRAVKIRREDDDALLYCFFIPLESGTEKRVALSQALTFSELAKELRKFTADIADDRSTAAEQVEAIIKKASEEVLIGATKVGWKQPNRKSATFVTPTWIKGPDGSRYAWLGPEEKSKSTAGSTAGWLAKIATPSMGSSYLSFALMLGLAGPLRKFADDLPEGAVFHFHGKDTTAKPRRRELPRAFSGHPMICRAGPFPNETWRSLQEGTSIIF